MKQIGIWLDKQEAKVSMSRPYLDPPQRRISSWMP